MPKGAWLLDLGLRDYREVWDLQHTLVERRLRDEIPDVLILVEHPPVITLGRKRPAKDPLRWPRERVEALGIAVYEVERGGEATFHGPGQLVGYPIIKLEGERRDLHRYLRDLEALLIDALGDFGLRAQRLAGATGVWTSGLIPRKIVSIGVAARRWVTYHGFALNVSVDLSFFELISPCGFEGAIMTSLERELGCPVPMEQVKGYVTQHFEKRFDCSLRLVLEPGVAA
jgi:lipoate-protein ligase B